MDIEAQSYNKEYNPAIDKFVFFVLFENELHSFDRIFNVSWYLFPTEDALGKYIADYIHEFFKKHTALGYDPIEKEIQNTILTAINKSLELKGSERNISTINQHFKEIPFRIGYIGGTETLEKTENYTVSTMRDNYHSIFEDKEEYNPDKYFGPDFNQNFFNYMKLLIYSGECLFHAGDEINELYYNIKGEYK